MRVLFLIVLLSPQAGISAGAEAQQETLALTYVTVIDATGAPARPDMTLVIAGGRITEIGMTGKVSVPGDALVVDAAGMFLIPGLWDMHAHTSYKQFLKLFIANGVTGVRDMGGTPEEFARLRQWRRQIADGTILGPRIVAAGIHVDGPKPLGRPDSLHVANRNGARQAVNFLKQGGADFVKVYSMLPREAYFAVAAEAKKQGLAFAGHVPPCVSAAEAADAGQRSMEHLFGILTACSKDEANLMKETAAAVMKSGVAAFVRAEIHAQMKALDSYDPKKAEGLFARFRKNGAWQVPTLVGWQSLSRADDERLLSDVRGKYIPPERLASWKTQSAGFLGSLGADYLANRHRLLEKQLELVGAMRRAGVELMAGTDTAALYVYPGFSLHDELALLVRAGLTPMEALQCATRNPAKYLGMLDSLGTVEKGKIADLVLLEADPLADIANTKKIAAVVVGGRLIRKAELQEMLHEVERGPDSQ
ncbi:MAG TPA: amidohydrolase family protein [Blastocatellia bacterium]|nr:amidohydrolase family protein [Blastocatellia bacterium]